MARQSAKSAKSSSANPSAKRPSAKRMRLDRAFESRDKQVYRNKRRRAAYKKHANINSSIPTTTTTTSSSSSTSTSTTTVPERQPQFNPNRNSISPDQQNATTTTTHNGETDGRTNTNIQLLATGTNVTKHNCGLLNQRCPHCDALYWPLERSGSTYTKCCHNGGINLPLRPPPPPYITELMTGNTEEAKHFKKFSQKINTNVSFASININDTFANNPGIPAVKVGGIIQHFIGPAQATEKPVFLASYFTSNDDNNHTVNEVCAMDVQISSKIKAELQQHNEFIRTLKSNMDNYPNIETWNVHLAEKVGAPTRTYNLPTTSNYLAAVVVGDLQQQIQGPRQITIKKNGSSNEVQQVYSTTGTYDPLSYVILHPHGESGYASNATMQQQNKITIMKWYKYYLHTRDYLLQLNQDILLRGAKLSLQYWVDQYLKMEENRLSYIRSHAGQTKLKKELYQGLKDAVERDDPNGAGEYTVLPSTFIGGPRHMTQLYEDSMALIAAHGMPDLFITFTCNPNWTEIQENLCENQSAWERPDLIARVFKMKLNQLMKDITGDNGIFGRCVAYTYTIEFQKRGLPHAHILLILVGIDFHDPIIIDQFISAEVPDPSSPLHPLVTTHMIHGPCGELNPHCPCMAANECTKHFPKELCNETLASENSYPTYRRRGTFTTEKRNHEIGDIWVVPHNPYLLKKYEAHINVEVVSTLTVVKYLYKYVHKGHDRAMVNVGPRSYDEVQNYVDSRYIGTPEAVWRLLGFPMHKMYPNIVRLPTHLPNQQTIYYNEGDEDAALERNHETQAKTKLLAFFRCVNDEYLAPLTDDQVGIDRHTGLPKPRATELTYDKFPQYYVWSAKDTMWNRRQRGKAFGRMYTVNIKNKEKFKLNQLLRRIKGPRSFQHLRTVHQVEYETFGEACKAMGLTEDDAESRETLQAGAQYLMPVQLRQLFVNVLLYLMPESPAELLQMQVLETTLFNLMSHDFAHERFQADSTSGKDVNDNDRNLCLAAIQIELHRNGNDITDFSLPTPPPNIVVTANSDQSNVQPPINYGNIVSTNYPTLTTEQSAAFDNIFESIARMHLNNKQFFFIDAPGGTGKTYLLNTFIAKYIDTHEKSSIAVCASSGIAAALLTHGKTAHSTFKIPLHVDDRTSSSVRIPSLYATNLSKIKLIVWDEISMASMYVVGVVDRLFRRILNNDLFFGGINVVFGGDYRQCLHIIPRANRGKIIATTIHNTDWWHSVTIFPLTKNLRIKPANDPANIEYAKFILDIGNNCAQVYDDATYPSPLSTPVILPKKYILPNTTEGDNTQSIKQLIQWAYPDIEANVSVSINFRDSTAITTGPNFKSKGILTPKLAGVKLINDTALQMMHGAPTTLYSCDKALEVVNQGQYPTHFINTVLDNCSGMPPHILELKVGCPVILLRNVDQDKKLCNGTKLIVLKIQPPLLTLRRVQAPYDIITLPRWKIQATGSMPFMCARTQFPIKLAFAFTINKAQGQSLHTCGIYLPNPVFSHGQLYVALSRATNAQQIKVLLQETIIQGKCSEDHNFYTQNIVYDHVLRRSVSNTSVDSDSSDTDDINI